MGTVYDVVVVGAGSSGCALAYRLAASSDLRVLLVEAGGPAVSPLWHIPLGFAFLLKEHKGNWNYHTRAEEGLNAREVALPRGKVMGGCSALNGMVYIRGQAEDYDDWAAAGNAGWAFDDVLPYFKRAEDREAGGNELHGSGGPLWVGNVNNEFVISEAFIAAAIEKGHSQNADLNGGDQSGVAFFPHNVRNGRRLSSASAYLGKSTLAGNLTILKHAEAARVLFEGTRATGVECYVKGKRRVILAEREVVLSAGAINSPKILEMSGVGQAELLQRHDIDVVNDLPGVGENLHDHWNAYIKQNVAQGSTYFSESKPLAMVKNLLRYLVKREGMLANPAALVAVFYSALEAAGRPDAQIHFSPAASELDKRGNMMPIDAITVSSCGTRPTSRGHTHICSPERQQAPDICVNYLQTEYDQQVAVSAFRKAREIMTADAFAPYKGDEVAPGARIDSDTELLEYIRNTGDPVHHLAGSCKMGRDEISVVDEKLRVHGIERLRIADASIMPGIVSGNTHAACVMIGEKSADLVLEEG